MVSSKVKVTLASELDHSGDVGVYIQSAGQELVFKPTDPRQLQLSLDANICQYVVPESEATYDFDVLYRWKFAKPLQTRAVLEFYVYELVKERGFLRDRIVRQPLTGQMRIEIPLLSDEEMEQRELVPDEKTTSLVSRIELELDFDLPEYHEESERARLMVTKIETLLRRFVLSKSPFLPDDMIQDWEAARKREAEPWRKPEKSELIEYSTFDQLRRIIIRNENWEKLFRIYFGRPEGIVARLVELDSIRNTIAHSRRISAFDYATLRNLHDQIVQCLRSR